MSSFDVYLQAKSKVNSSYIEMRLYIPFPFDMELQLASEHSVAENFANLRSTVTNEATHHTHTISDNAQGMPFRTL